MYKNILTLIIFLFQETVYPSKEELDGGRFWTIQKIYDAMGKDVLTPNLEEEIEWLAKFQDIVKFTQF